MTRDELDLRARSDYEVWRRDRPKIIAVDTETTGLDFYDTAFCVTVSWRRPDGSLYGAYLELTEDTRPLVWEILYEADTLLFHNAKFDLQKLWLADCLPTKTWEIDDTETLAHLLDEHQRIGLKSLAREHLGHKTDEEAVLKETFKKLKLKKSDGYHKLPREVLIPYAVEDTNLTYRLWELFKPQVARYPELLNLYELEMKLLRVMYKMWVGGMKVDRDYLEHQARELASRDLELETDLRQLVGREDFNPNSPQQLLTALHERGIMVTATNKKELAGVDDELVHKVKELRSIRKIHGTYIVAMLQQQRDGMIHPWFNTNATTSGRSSSSKVRDE